MWCRISFQDWKLTQINRKKGSRYYNLLASFFCNVFGNDGDVTVWFMVYYQAEMDANNQPDLTDERVSVIISLRFQKK